LTLTKLRKLKTSSSTNGADHPSELNGVCSRQFGKSGQLGGAQLSIRGAWEKSKPGAIAHEKRLYALVLFKWIYSPNRAALAALYSDAQLVVVYQFLIEAGTQDCVPSRYLLPSALKSDKVEMATHSIAKLDEIQSQLGSVQTVEENALLYR